VLHWPAFGGRRQERATIMARLFNELRRRNAFRAGIACLVAAWFVFRVAGAADPARKLSDVFTKLQRASAASERIFTMMDREPKVCDPVNPKSM